eukprot:2682931-Amphidinium_carterae.1
MVFEEGQKRFHLHRHPSMQRRRTAPYELSIAEARMISDRLKLFRETFFHKLLRASANCKVQSADTPFAELVYLQIQSGRDG